MSLHTVREYARLTTSPTPGGSLDVATVSPAAFEWLCQENARLKPGGATLVQLEDRRNLRLDNYVGVLQAPDGTRIEILPKAFAQADDATRARWLLRKMLSTCLNVPFRQSANTQLQTGRVPLNEWVMRRFVEELDLLVKRGLRFDYQRVQEEQRFLRGRLDFPRQMRQPPGRGYVFQIEHDVFSADRAENRLLKSALLEVCGLTKEPDVWRWSHQLAAIMHEVPCSRDVKSDMAKWSEERLMTSYRAVRPWCSLILQRLIPLAMVGEWQGPSLLFPMEQLFERYVEICLKRQVGATASVHRTPSDRYLCSHDGRAMFKLKPDLALHQAKTMVAIMDTKWKRLDDGASSSGEKYGLSQADFYQMFAYGHRYLDGQGTMALIYPLTQDFSAPLPPFAFSDVMSLHVLPFDLVEDRLIGLDRILPSPVQAILAA